MPSSQSPAESYEAFMVRFRFRPWAEELLDRVVLAPGVRMLDVACGTGIVARAAAQRLRGAGIIDAIDMNPAMIEVGRRAAAEEDVSIRWHVGNVESLPFPDRSFDLVTIQQALQFFPDQPAALRECLRVLAPGGTLAVGIWSALEKQGIQQDYAEAVERVTGSASMHTSYGTVSEESLRDLFIEVGFVGVSIEEAAIELDYGDPATFVNLMVEGTSVGVPAMQGRSDQERAALTAAVADDMRSAIAAATRDGRLRTHSTVFIALGHRPN